MIRTNQGYIISMSFEFTNKIEELTNKLTQAHKNKDDRIEEAKEQLIALQSFISKELGSAEKRMKKIQGKLQKRSIRASRQSESVEEIWQLKEEKVSEVINSWVNEYEQRLQQAIVDLDRQNLIFNTKIEEQEDQHSKEVKTIEDKIKNQLKTLEKELDKWQNINTQGQNAVSKELALYRQLMTRDISNSKEIKEREIRALELRIGRVKQNCQEKVAELKKDMEKKDLKTAQIFEMLLHI